MAAADFDSEFDSEFDAQFDPENDEPLVMPIEDHIDLHTFSPKEIKPLVEEYLYQCHQRGFPLVRIIHGKGMGNLRRTVHALLSKHPEVISYTLDHPQYGAWGATLVSLRRRA